MKLLEGQSALVLGGSGFLGSRIAESLALEGARVIIHYHAHKEKADEIIARIRISGGEASAVRADIRRPEEIRSLIGETVALYGALHIAVDSTYGDFTPKPVFEMDWEDWEIHLDALKGHFFLCKESLPYMRKQGYGRIVFISGGLSRRFFRGCSAYTAIKSGINGFCKTLALEEGEHGITVNIVAPGKVVATHETHGEARDEIGDISAHSIPLMRFATPHDVAGAVLYFVSSGASGITGQTLFVAGGEIMP